MKTAFAAGSWRRSALDFLLLFGLALLLFSTPSAQADSVGDAAETRSLHALFDARWEELMRTYPEWATYSGDHRYGERLHDASAAAQVAGFDAHRRALAQAGPNGTILGRNLPIFSRSSRVIWFCLATFSAVLPMW